MKECFYDIPSLKDACEEEIERVRREREKDGQNNITFNFHLGYEYGIQYVLNCLEGYILCEDEEPHATQIGTTMSDDAGRPFDHVWGMYVDEFEDFSDEEEAEHQRVLDEQYKDTGININDLA